MQSFIKSSIEATSRSLYYKEKDSIHFFLGEGDTLEQVFLCKLRKLPFMQELKDASANILRLFNNACYICTLVYNADYAPLERKEYERIAIDSHDDPLWANYMFPATMALVVSWLSADESKKIWDERGKKKDIEELCKDICESFEEHSNLLDEVKENFKGLISSIQSFPSGFVKDGSFLRRSLSDIVKDHSIKEENLFNVDSLKLLEDIVKNNPSEWENAFGQGSWFLEAIPKASFNPEGKLRELWEILNRKYKDNNEQPSVKEVAFNGQTGLPCFTNCQMGILMTAVGRITEKDNPPGKTTIGEVVQRIAGYGAKSAAQSMKGSISDNDKKIVANVLKSQYPNLAEEVMKL